MSRVIRQIPPDASLHEIGELFQLTYLAEQDEQFLSCLRELIAGTERAAPVRRTPYPLVRTHPGDPRGEEARWERAIWREWHTGTPAAPFIPGVCTRIVSYQMMLRDTNR